MTDWTPHGSDADYWRSDNPFLIAWYRFGDDNPDSVALKVTDDDGNRSYASGLIVDSGPRQYHLLHRPAADLYLRPTSGIAPWSSSGVIFGEQPGTSWVEGNHGNILFIDPQSFHDASVGASRGLGPISFGTETHPSGFTIMGWIDIPDTATNPSLVRQIFGDAENGILGSVSNFRMAWRPNARALSISLKFNGDASLAIVSTSADPFPTRGGEPFFVACQVRREEGVPGGWKNTVNGSGIIDLYIGTEVSGLRLVNSLEFFRNETRVSRKAETQNFYTFAQDSLPSRIGSANARHLPPLSRMDEWVLVNDGRMSKTRMEHYMNSGIQHITADDPLDIEFMPTPPGLDGLVAYWSFDDQTGTNSAPSTSGLGLDVIMDASLGDDIAPVPGIRGGSGIRPGGVILKGQNLSAIGNNREAFPHVPINSGFNHIFPDINQSDQWTWIGWIRARQDGTNHYGGSVGWMQGSVDTLHDAYGVGDWNTGTNSTGASDQGRGLEWSASGINDAFTNGPGPDVGGNLIGPIAHEWQLWALVFDFRHGLFYTVRDAKNERIETNRISSVSGISKALLNSDSAFLFSSINNVNNNRLAEFDDWAIYNRKLSIPEMSGYALSGIAEQVFTSPFGTSFKQTLGYWVFEDDKVNIYDPEGISGVRYDDQSWYRHHLTNVSGGFTIDDTVLNSRVASSQSLRVDVSGSMLSLEKVFTGANLDFSTTNIYPPSGFTIGAFAYLPSGDLETQGNGSSGLFGDHHIMGSWGTELATQSWQFGITDNKPFLTIHPDTLSLETVTSSEEIPFNTPIFLAALFTPSGGAATAELYMHDGDFDELSELRLIGRSEFFPGITPLNAGSESGFSLLNVPERQQGFPSGTLLQGAFVYAGAMNTQELTQVARAGIQNTVLASGEVSATDPANISHWRWDLAGSRVEDVGKEQNFVFPINQDGHQVGVIRSVHNSGVVVRQPEYYDTLPFNDQSRRLDLGSGNQSWTFLSWVLPPVVSNTDRHYIMAKSDGLSGVQIFTPSDSLQSTVNASGAVGRGENGNLAPSQWNHLAIVYDRDNNELTTIINGRYAGTTFDSLPEIPVNNSGMALGGRGDQLLNALTGGSAFSGYLDDTILFSRAMTLPEISGLAANSYNFNDGSTQPEFFPVGAYLSGLPQFIISGLIGSFIHGQAQDLELVAGYVRGVSGVTAPYGGFMHGRAFVSGHIGHFLHGAGLASGHFGHFVHGLDIVSGFIGAYEFGACETNGEFDVVLNFSVVTNKDFDARLGVEKTQLLEFDSRLGVIRITRPPGCTFEAPLIGELGSGVPYILTVSGSGIAQDNKKIAMTRFTFADFKGAESGTLVGGEANSGLFEAQREFDTPGWYTIKLEILDSYGYRSSCCRPFLLVPSGVGSGVFINSLPGISIETAQQTGSAIHTVSFTHSISGLSTTSGLLEYTDFADQQESLVNSLEMPLNTQFVDFVRRHDYTMPGFYCPVWSVSGEFGIVSDTIADGIDYLV